MVILLCGFKDDQQINLLIDSLKKKNANYVFLDEETLSDDVALRWQITEVGLSGYLKVRDQVFNIKEICSAYHRFIDPEVSLGSYFSQEVVDKTRSIMRSLMDLLDIIPIRIVNRRRAMMSNNSKPYQGLLIRQAGFEIPETLITNDSKALSNFIHSYKSIVYKSTSSVRSIVASFDERSADKMKFLAFLATQFQAKIEGFNVRVHVVGQKIFATKVNTSATDYRYASYEGTFANFYEYELTRALRQKCIRLARLCGLSFAGIDLIINPHGVYCLEVNPSPGYSYYQQATDQPISEALADLLINGKKLPKKLGFALSIPLTDLGEVL